MMGDVTQDDYFYDDKGSRFRKYFCKKAPRVGATLTEDVFEDRAVREAVDTFSHDFAMIELGCGYARWLVTANRYLAEKGCVPRALFGVEPEPRHCCWAREAMRDNAVAEETYTIVNAAVSDADGQLYLQAVDQSIGETRDCARVWYGQRVVTSSEMPSGPPERIEPYEGRDLLMFPGGVGYVAVDTARLEDILRRLERVALLDMDVQGVEAQIICSNIDVVSQTVKRLYVGTHSKAIEENLRDALLSNNWVPRLDFSLGMTHSFEGQSFFCKDGIMYFENQGLPRW